jgi:hypothetical protein
MKTLLLLILGTAIFHSTALSQGTILFANRTATVDAPVSNAAGNRIVGPGPYVADLFWSGDTNTPINSLTPAGFNQPFLTTTASGGGYFVAGTKTLSATGYIKAQVRVWDTTFGATYEQARDNGAEFGESNPILVYLTIPPPPAADMTGLEGFQLGRIPEPSVGVLAVVGGAVLCWKRKRNLRCNRAWIETRFAAGVR